MNDKQKAIHPRQESVRGALRLLGPVILAIGVLFVLVGGVDFFSKAGSAQMPTKFWCFFVGLPLLALGGTLTRLGFMGAVARYTVGEYAPVAKDTVNYMAEGTSDAVQDLAQAVGQGLAAGTGSAQAPRVRCHKCNAGNDTGARFCSQCGTALLKTRPCSECSELNDPDARFCDNCGHPF